MGFSQAGPDGARRQERLCRSEHVLTECKAGAAKQLLVNGTWTRKVANIFRVSGHTSQKCYRRNRANPKRNFAQACAAHVAVIASGGTPAFPQSPPRAPLCELDDPMECLNLLGPTTLSGLIISFQGVKYEHSIHKQTLNACATEPAKGRA